MSHLTNRAKTVLNSLPLELQDSVRFYTARLTQAAGILLRLPQDVTAKANVLLFRYWAVGGLMEFEFAVCFPPSSSLSYLFPFLFRRSF